MNSSAKQILIGWIYRRIGFLKRGMKKQIKPLAAILRFLDFSTPLPLFRAQREIFLTLCSFLLLSRKDFPSLLSHIRHYPLLQERSLDFARDDVTEVAFSQHIRCTLREINPSPHTVISSAARNLPRTPLFLAPFAKGFPFSAITHTALYQCARKIPRLRSG